MFRRTPLAVPTLPKGVVGHCSQDRCDRLLLVPQPRAQSSLSATAGTPCAAVSSVASSHGPPAWVRPKRIHKGNANLFELCGVCGGVLWWCVVVVRVCVVCGEAWHTLSLSLSLLLSLLPLLFPFLCLSYLSLSFSLAPSLTLALAHVLPLSLLSSFFPSTHSSLLCPSRQQTLWKEPINQHGVQLLRRLNVMWRTVRS